MENYPEFEFSLRRMAYGRYGVDFRFAPPWNDVDVHPTKTTIIKIDFVRLRELANESNYVQYGKLLGHSLFGQDEIANAFRSAQQSTQEADREMRLRLRLHIGSNAPELNSILWETVIVPSDSQPLFQSERVLCSRYLASYDWQPVRLRPRRELTAAIVIANPKGLEGYAPNGKSFESINVAGEHTRAKNSLLGISTKEFVSKGQASISNLTRVIREGCDIVYLVCHGTISEGEPWLWLEDADGKIDRVSGDELVNCVKGVLKRPRLIVLASCQSAGAGLTDRGTDEAAMMNLGPRLAQSGVPAVLAMQSDVETETLEKFMPVFFRELQIDGQLDRAMAVARNEIRKQPDWWAPVLLMRLKSGCIWFSPGFSNPKDFPKWGALANNINRGTCTPILGPGISEQLLGSRREIAKRWAEAHHFPMASHAREDLPQVAQYLAINQDPNFARTELQVALVDHLNREMRKFYPQELEGIPEKAPLGQLISHVGRVHRKNNPEDPYRLLAELPLKLYLTVNPSNQLFDALKEVGKEPVNEVCRWRKALKFESIFKKEPGFEPSVERPLVYHLFGHLDEPRSIVLTEDDHFDYLIALSSDKKAIPEIVGRALTDTALLFLGFQLDEWVFRVVFRTIMNKEGRARLESKDYAHVAAQISPEEGRMIEPERARKYLEDYFQGAAISIFWGNARDFLSQIKNKRNVDR